MRKAVLPVAEAPPGAKLVKLSGDFLIACVIVALGEAMALVAKGGMDRSATSTSLPRPCSTRRSCAPMAA
jgi:3-hydroxyisobutyrate dehydrogenase-like beta-hydroxyacid dehydrogenase